MAESKKIRFRRRSFQEIRRDKMQEARSKVVDTIIERTDKEKEIDLVKEFHVSSLLLGDYVTLDWPH